MDGIVIVNKPKGYTSHDIVKKVKKIFHEKVGHTGTLDPNATGVLPILVGQGTKLSKYLINHDKEYTVTLALGAKTDTADTEGKIIEEKEVPILTDSKIKNVLESFIGKQKQIPPMYSAIKVDGKKLYEYARKNEKVEVSSREIEIYDISLLNYTETEILFHVKCSKGTYIRTLCEDIAEKLETVGYMKELQRTVVGSFKLSDAIEIDNEEKIKNGLISIENFFKNSKSIFLNSKKIKLFLNGVNLETSLQDGLYKVYDEEKIFLGIGVVKNSLLKREIIVENKHMI